MDFGGCKDYCVWQKEIQTLKSKLEQSFKEEVKFEVDTKNHSFNEKKDNKYHPPHVKK